MPGSHAARVVFAILAVIVIIGMLVSLIVTPQ
jgi:hypothetical protein